MISRWLIIGLLLTSTSCIHDFGISGDIWPIGGPDKITENTLQQRDRWEIMRRIVSLVTIAARLQVEGRTPSLSEQREAETGLLRIHQRLLGNDWNVFFSEDFAPDVQRVNDPAEQRAFLAKFLYYACSRERARKEFYHQLRPPDNRPNLLRVWKNPSTFLKQEEPATREVK